MEKIMIAMSGGVDSSVAALLLKNAGNVCAGATLRLYDNEAAGVPLESGCCSLADVEDARAVAAKLSIPFYVFNFTREFREQVLGPFAAGYADGRTPNPCVACNRRLKFGALLQRARLLGYDALATGHYARVGARDGLLTLEKALDPDKDQSYFLYRLTQDELAHVRFPLGRLHKTETRALAEAAGLVCARKKDSQDLCFAPDGDCAAAVERILGRTFPPGPFLSEDGRVLGRHRGIARYTVGQRRGLGLPSDGRLYVKRIDPAQNAVILAPDAGLWSGTLCAEDFHWIAGRAPAGPVRAAAKIRYSRGEAPCLAIPEGERAARVEFDAPQRAAAPGQSVVVYDGETVLGGGIIV
jgi:tRNA-specific 2-thiouridylase